MDKAVGSELAPIPKMPETTSLTPSRQELDILMEIANAVAASNLPLPPSCSTPQGILVKLLYGREMGLSPMASLYEIDIIEGKAALNARTMVGLIRRRELGDIQLITSTDEEAVVKAWRANRPDDVQEFSFTRDDAEKADLLRRKVYQRYLASMLLARAQAKAAKAMFQDVFIGIAYTAEELGAEVNDAGRRKVEFIDTAAVTGVTRKPSQQVTPLETQTIADTVDDSGRQAAAAAPPTTEFIPTPVQSQQTAEKPRTEANDVDRSKRALFLDQIKQLAQNVLKLNKDHWSFLMKKWRSEDRSMTIEEIKRLRVFLGQVSMLRWLKGELQIPDNKWNRALQKRGALYDFELSERNAEELVTKLSENITPFKLAEQTSRLTAQTLAEMPRNEVDRTRQQTIAGKV